MPVSERRNAVRPSIGLVFPLVDQPARRNESDPDDHRDVCGIVLAGSPHSSDSPFDRVLRDPLVPVAQTPIICYPIEWLRRAGVGHAIVCAGSATSALRASFGDGLALGLPMGYFEDVEPRGPAGCAHDAARRSHASVFVVVEGCMIPGLDLAALIAAHRRSRAIATVVVEVERRRRSLGPALDVAGGIYVFDRRALESVPTRGYHDIKEGLLERLYKAGERVLKYEVPGLAPRVLDWPTYSSVNRWLISRSVEQPGFLSEYRRVGDALIHPSASVASTARLCGPVIVGPAARIADHALVVGPTSIGTRSQVGTFASVSRTVVWEDCLVGAAAIVDASLLATGATVQLDEQVFGAVVIPPHSVPRAATSWIARFQAPAVAVPPALRIVRPPRDFVLPSHPGPQHHRLDDRPPLR